MTSTSSLPPSSNTTTIRLLNTLAPSSPSRAWQSAPHPYLPLVATACSDKVVRIYSLATFTLQSQITGGHKRSVRAVAWRPGLRSDPESVLATGSFDATTGIWRGENRKRRIGARFIPGRSTVQGGGGGGGGNNDDDSDDGLDGLEGNDGDDEEPLDSGDEDDYAYAVQLSGHDSEVKSLTWSPHGTFLATCSRDKSVWIWESLPDEDDNLETVAVLQEHEGDVKCVSWHPADEGCLVSASYDEVIRIWREDTDGEWTCVGLATGHQGTVWMVDWEPTEHAARLSRLEYGSGEAPEALSNGLKSAGDDTALRSGPRIISCSDDLTIRVWRRKPKAPPQPQSHPRIPSVIRSTSDEENWYEEQRLPKAHDRPIYAVSWSETTGKVVSCGSDGRIVVYEEKVLPNAENTNVKADVGMQDGEESNGNANTNRPEQPPPGERSSLQTQWLIVAEFEAAHDVFEVNHVCWARRYDNETRHKDEEIIISTGDDGKVKTWTLGNP